MQIYNRYIDLYSLVGQSSYFLLGIRQSGKSWLIENQLSSRQVDVIDLLNSEVYLDLQRNPEKLRSISFGKSGIVVIDEIQRVPALLNEVHWLIEKKRLKFLLTGSSARKLRKDGVNLLGGRAKSQQLHPLTSAELGRDFNLNRALSQGSMPTLFRSSNFRADVSAYVENYLQMEIATEGLTRNLPAFSRFLEVAALDNSQIINYSKIANDAQVAPSTVQEYYQILRDTLLGFDLPVWQGSIKRKATKTSKFYFVDIGIVNGILRRYETTETDANFGEVFESFVFHELKARTDYLNLEPLSYWHSQQKDEVDFIFNNTSAIEVKSAKKLRAVHLKALKILAEEKKHKRYLLVCREHFRQNIDGIEIWPVTDFLSALWQGEFD